MYNFKTSCFLWHWRFFICVCLMLNFFLGLKLKRASIASSFTLYCPFDIHVILKPISRISKNRHAVHIEFFFKKSFLDKGYGNKQAKQCSNLLLACWRYCLLHRILNPHLQMQLSWYCQELCFSCAAATQLLIKRAYYVENVKYYQFKFLIWFNERTSKIWLQLSSVTFSDACQTRWGKRSYCCWCTPLSNCARLRS